MARGKPRGGRSPFGVRSHVRFSACEDPACLCHRAVAWHGDVGTVTYTRGLSILVEFYDPPMSTEIAFRKATCRAHLEKIVDTHYKAAKKEAAGTQKL